MTPPRILFLATWRVTSSTLISLLSLPWIFGYLIRRWKSPIVLVYVNAPVPSGIDPAQSKYSFFKVIEARNPALAALYPPAVLIGASHSFEERLEKAKRFMDENNLSYPIVGKPGKGSRSLGAYRIDGEEGLQHLLKRIQ